MSPITFPFTDAELEYIQEVNKIPLELLPEVMEPIKIGPTWQADENGDWILPEYTLGWQIAAWCTDYLLTLDEDADPDDELPWEFTLEQLRFILWWYAVDENGRFIYRTGTLQRLKGWGKDPILAVICLVELCGPSRFSHWDEDGNPVGAMHPFPYVQVAALTAEQTTNTMDLIPSLMSPWFKEKYQVDPQKEIIRALNGRCQLKAVTGNWRALEGKRTTFTLLNETQHWLQVKGGHQMYYTIDGNATKKDSRYLAITNAYVPGEDSVGEKMRNAWEEVDEANLDPREHGILYDSLEAHPSTPLLGPLAEYVLDKIRGDSHWLKVDSIVQSILKPDIPPSRSRRMWLNQIVAEEDALHGPETWDILCPKDENGQCTIPPLSEGDEVCVGFDGGKSDDATAIVVERVRDRAVFLYGLWEKPEIARGPEDEKWVVDRTQVDSTIHEIFRLYKVKAFYADVALWESYVDSWGETYGDTLEHKAGAQHPIAWDMRALRKATLAHERLLSAIREKKIKHNGDKRLRRHTLNARRRDNQHGVHFSKEHRESRRKVDAYAAMILAHEAMNDYLQRRKTEKPRSKRVWAY